MVSKQLDIGDSAELVAGSPKQIRTGLAARVREHLQADPRRKPVTPGDVAHSLAVGIHRVWTVFRDMERRGEVTPVARGTYRYQGCRLYRQRAPSLKGRVLRAMYYGPRRFSVPEIAKILGGVSRDTVWHYVSELLASGELARTGIRPGVRGSPRQLLRIVNRDAFFLKYVKEGP
jgi:hypothetical protein